MEQHFAATRGWNTYPFEAKYASWNLVADRLWYAMFSVDNSDSSD